LGGGDCDEHDLVAPPVPEDIGFDVTPSTCCFIQIHLVATTMHIMKQSTTTSDLQYQQKASDETIPH